MSIWANFWVNLSLRTFKKYPNLVTLDKSKIWRVVQELLDEHHWQILSQKYYFGTTKAPYKMGRRHHSIVYLSVMLSFNWCISRYYISTIIKSNTVNILYTFSDFWIQTADFLCWKWPLYQLILNLFLGTRTNDAMLVSILM